MPKPAAWNVLMKELFCQKNIIMELMIFFLTQAGIWDISVLLKLQRAEGEECKQISPVIWIMLSVTSKPVVEEDVRRQLYSGNTMHQLCN